ncbi:MAG: hypothetical protein EPO62_02295 [Candidatus Nitrosotenuis sp.]|nr:MAG: hypothetical protein EPO62_02295 [Candidatus Nitrosotenuis sp.]
MKKSAKVIIVAGICAAVITGGLAIFVHFKLSDVEKNETGQESAEQVAKEAQDVLSGKEPHSEQNETARVEEKTKTISEEGESAEQRAKELP